MRGWVGWVQGTGMIHSGHVRSALTSGKSETTSANATSTGAYYGKGHVERGRERKTLVRRQRSFLPPSAFRHTLHTPEGLTRELGACMMVLWASEWELEALTIRR